MRDNQRRGFGGGRRQGGFRSSGGSSGSSFGRPRFGDSRPSFESRESPVKVGEEYNVEITETGSKGDGITRIKNFVVFVPETKKGDKVKIRITEIRGRSAVAEVVGGGSKGEDDAEGDVDSITEEGMAKDVSKEEYEEDEESEDTEM